MNFKQVSYKLLLCHTLPGIALYVYSFYPTIFCWSLLFSNKVDQGFFACEKENLSCTNLYAIKISVLESITFLILMQTSTIMMTNKLYIYIYYIYMSKYNYVSNRTGH